MDEYQRIARMALAVAYATANQAQCVFGVALLQETALHFGCEIRPRAVSMVAQRVDQENAQPVVTGRMATDYVAANGGGTDISGVAGAPIDSSEFQRAGHMIATLELPALLIDPTFGQFTVAGLPDIVPVTAFDPKDEEACEFSDERVRVLYLFDDTNQGWQEGYEFARRNSRDAAAEIAEHLRRGGEPYSHGISFA